MNWLRSLVEKCVFWQFDTISLASAYSSAMIFLKAQFTNWTSQENCVLCNCVQKFVCRLKNPKNNAFIDNNSPKETWAIENLTYDISSTLWSVYTKFGWFRPTVAEKNRYKKLKRKGMSRTGKKRNLFDVSLREKASLRSPINKLQRNSVKSEQQHIKYYPQNLLPLLPGSTWMKHARLVQVFVIFHSPTDWNRKIWSSMENV